MATIKSKEYLESFNMMLIALISSGLISFKL